MFAPDPRVIFDNVTLTASAAGNTSTGIEFRSRGDLILFPEYDSGSAETNNNVEIAVEYSPDNSEWFPYGVWADGGSGQMNFTARVYNVDDAENAPIVLTDIVAGYYRVTALEEGVASNFGTLTLTAYELPMSSCS